MPDRLKKIQEQILGYWNKFNAKQKRLIISVTAVILIALGVLGWAISRPTYATLIQCSTPSDAADVKNVLDGEDIFYSLSDDGLVFTVNKNDLARATLKLAESNVPSTGYSYSDILDNGGLIPPTESQRRLQEKLLKETKIENTLKANEYVKNAWVELTIPEKSYSVLNQNEETSASVTVELREDLPIGVGENLAKTVAYMVGNTTTAHVIIIDTMGQVVFYGDTADASVKTNVSTQVGAREQLENSLRGKIKNLIISTGTWDQIEVAPNLDVNFSESNTTNITYKIPEDRKEGYYTNSYISEQEGTSGNGGVPGTASNGSEDGTTYEMGDNGSSSTSRVEQIAYALDQSIEEIKGAAGTINLENSSVSVALTRFRVYNEDTLRAQGQLEQMTFDEFQAANSETLMVEVDPSIIEAVSRATGITEANISVIAYEQPLFQASVSEGFDIQTYLPLIVTLLIVGLLAFVVFRSTRPVEVTEVEPELSIDNLLASTTSQQPLEDIDLQDKSEARKAIEKFVDENPEAVALLLRNWLDDGWE